MKIALMMAITLDGKIAQSANHLADWTSHADKKIFVEKTKEAGVIIMGRATYDTIGRPLPGRLNVILTSSPNQYESTSKNLKYLSGSPQEVISYLEKKGYTMAILGGGAKTNTAFLKAGLIDTLYITIEPKLFGTGIGLFEQEQCNINVELVEVKQIGTNSLFLTYNVKK